MVKDKVHIDFKEVTVFNARIKTTRNLFLGVIALGEIVPLFCLIKPFFNSIKIFKEMFRTVNFSFCDEVFHVIRFKFIDIEAELL